MPLRPPNPLALTGIPSATNFEESSHVLAHAFPRPRRPSLSARCRPRARRPCLDLARAAGRGGVGSCPDDAAGRLDGAGAGLARGHRHGAEGEGRAARAALRTPFLLLMVA